MTPAELFTVTTVTHDTIFESARLLRQHGEIEASKILLEYTEDLLDTVRTTWEQRKGKEHE